MEKINLPLLWPVTCHTNYVGKNSTFVAVKGHKEDGIKYIPLALQKGARKIVAEYTADIPADIIQAIQNADAWLEFVPSARRALAYLSADAWEHPVSKLKIIGITGTKGKTTTAWLLHHLLHAAGKKAALLSTVQNKIDLEEFDTELTTQHPDYLHAFFHTCVNAGMEYVVMEVAAQAASLHRVAGIEFDGLIFTNFSATHGEFYTTTHDYYQAKRTLFDYCKKDAHLVINADDQKGQELLQEFKTAYSFGVSDTKSYVTFDNDHSSIHGIAGNCHNQDQSYALSCPTLIGSFNAYNILAASTMAFRLGISWDTIAHGLTTFCKIPGRLEKYIVSNGAICFIDYAHNPLSFQAVLSLLRSLTDHLIVVAGAGGNRDTTMRPVLGKLMSEYADYAIFTTDNPRLENPADIIAALYAGVAPDKKNKVIGELDRQKAIEKAYLLSNSGSIIALLGKGPEQYQIIGTAKIPFSERTIVQQL